ncbi:cytochrome P450 [Nocardia cyriacigeorgica]|uniref:cytochrome P450 n=1 Tax=Nocardia cyriacigeorgica TaxID=135487 RepID=UPI001893CCCF|nr:cytochrome P450 [Nocardia cyriacigeorgica]MBF6098616.1 cytochrome P450 [Nocardia cyriacigeorgica]
MSADTAHIVGKVLLKLAEPDGRADPYPLYEQLRACGPAVAAPDGTIVVTGYRLVSALARDHRLRKRPETSLAANGFPHWRQRPGLRLIFGSMLVANPPEHTRLRRLVSGAFTSRRVAGMRAAIEGLVTGLLDRMEAAGAHGPIDFIDEFAFPLPVTVIGELLGIPDTDRMRFQPLVRDWTAVLDRLDEPTVAAADTAADTIIDYLGELIARRRRAPADDLLSALTTPGDGLPDDELITMAALLFAAGFETTTGLLANSLHALLDHPGQADQLRQRPELAGPAVEELLRYNSPVQLLTSRTAPEAMNVGGLELAAGQRVIMLLGAANHDPEVFDDPARLRLDRDGEPPLSFGGGIHYCLGAPLARLEAQIAVPALLRRFPGLARAADPVPRDGLALHGLVHMPIQLH